MAKVSSRSSGLRVSTSFRSAGRCEEVRHPSSSRLELCAHYVSGGRRLFWIEVLW